MMYTIPQHGFEILQEVVEKEGWQMAGHCQAKPKSPLLAQNMAETLSSHYVVVLMAFSRIYHLLCTPTLMCYTFKGLAYVKNLYQCLFGSKKT